MSYPKVEKSEIFNLGKLPPQAPEIEEAVIGALLIESRAVDRVADVLKPHHFYKDAHEKIYLAIMTLYVDGREIDILTVTEQLRKVNELEFCGGAYYITQLSTKVNSTAHLEAHMRILLEKHMKRALIRLSADVQTKAYADTEDSFDLLQEAENGLVNIATDAIARDAQRMRESYKEYILKIESIQKAEAKLSGIPCGLIDVDRITQGWQPSDLIILAARPGMGKTALAVQIILNISLDFDIPTAIFSLEMSTQQLVARMVAVETDISTDRQRVGDIGDWGELLKNTAKLSDAPIYTDDTAALSIVELRAKARRLVNKHGVKLVVVDYLQLMTGVNNNSREQEIASISRSLKGLAKELNIPVLALSQLSRKVEERNDKRPILSDLRESGSIEQDADVVAFMYREDYYLHEESPKPGETEIIIEKNRNGKTGRVYLRFIPDVTKFIDYTNITNVETEAPF
jgi:replicative DNA helicase